MLTDKSDAYYVGNVISTWAQRYVNLHEEAKLETHKQVVAQLGSSGFTTRIQAGNHGFVADESEVLGGNDFGPSPYELLNAALAACTAMTLQMYARRKKWDLKDVKVHLSYDRSYKEDCDQCSEAERRLEHFDKSIELIGDLDESQKARLLEIAERCPVHRTLAGESKFRSEVL
jgi:putative redox protein